MRPTIAGEESDCHADVVDSTFLWGFCGISEKKFDLSSPVIKNEISFYTKGGIRLTSKQLKADFPNTMNRKFICSAIICATAGVASAATLANRWSFTDDTADSVGGNTGVLVGDASVSGGQLVLDGAPNGPGADSMGFTTPLDIGGTHGANGVTIESWYTDTGSGSWSKLFSFGNGTGGRNIIFNLQQGGSGQGRVQYQGMGGEFNFGARPSLSEEHYLALTISPEGLVNLYIDGAQIPVVNGATTGDGNDLSTLPSSWERIGASNWGDAGMSGSVNEFRIWDGELSAGEVSQSFALGPDSVVPEPASSLLLGLGSLFLFFRRRS